MTLKLHSYARAVFRIWGWILVSSDYIVCVRAGHLLRLMPGWQTACSSGMADGDRNQLRADISRTLRELSCQSLRASTHDSILVLASINVLKHSGALL